MKLPVWYRKADLLTLPLIVLGSFLLLLLPLHKQGNAAVIAIGGRTIAVIDLQQDQPSLSVKGAEGFVFSVVNGAICVSQSPCDGKNCCHTPPVSHEGQWILCLPMQLSVTVLTEEPGTAPDAIIG